MRLAVGPYESAQAELEPAAEALRQIGYPGLRVVEGLIEQARGAHGQKSQGESAG